LQWLARKLVPREGVIQCGLGKGLRFDATGGYPGYLLGTSEPEEQALLGRLLKPGMVFYDIGANIGFYSTLAAGLVTATGRVCAFEPFPESARLCRKNALSNGFAQVTVVEAAVGAENARVTLSLGEGSAMHKVAKGGPGIEVPVVAIDSWRRETGAPAPQVVMIDVEGAEIEVMRGMLTTIKDSLPVLLVEVHWLGESFVDFVRLQLEPLGYRLTTYAGGAVPPGYTRYHALLAPSGSNS
jgi:FkbM family methyltransferase